MKNVFLKKMALTAVFAAAFTAAAVLLPGGDMLFGTAVGAAMTGRPTANSSDELTVHSSGDYEYTVNEDGVSVSIIRYKGKGGVVEIPSKLGGKKVTKIMGVLNKDDKSIVDGTFEECKGLTKVIIPDSVSEIGMGAFYGCEELKNVVIPEGVERIGNEAFARCSGLESIKLPESVSVIGKCAFSSSGLKEIYIPGGVSEIGQYAFSTESLISAYFNDNVTDMGDLTFCLCHNLKNVHISKRASEIGESMFGFCEELENIDMIFR